MLKTVLSISGRPGLYRLVNRGKNMLIVESISTKNALRPMLTTRLFLLATSQSTLKLTMCL